MIVQEIVGFSCVGYSGRIITQPAIQNDSGSILAGLVNSLRDHMRDLALVVPCW
jgi:hypothetical protein